MLALLVCVVCTSLIAPSSPTVLARRAYFHEDDNSSFWFDCNYHSIESNYFQRNGSDVESSNYTNTRTMFVLASGSRLAYRCLLIIDTRNCVTPNQSQPLLPPPINCQDVQVDIRPPSTLLAQGKSVTLFMNDPNVDLCTDKHVQEGFTPVPYHSGFDKYLIWLNVSNFTSEHSGEYHFTVQLMPSQRTLFQHHLVLSPHCKFCLFSLLLLSLIFLPLATAKRVASIAPPLMQLGPFSLTPLASLMVVFMTILVLILVIIASFVFLYFLRNSSLSISTNLRQAEASMATSSSV